MTPASNAHALLYTPIDQLSTYTPPALGSSPVATQYAYDFDGKLTKVARPDGVNLVYGYDSAFRLSTQTVPQGKRSRTYDPKTGQLSTVSAPGGETVTYGYDGFLKTGVTWSGPVAGSLVLGFDTNFRVHSQTVNAGTKLLFGYDADSLLTSAGAIAVNYDSQNGLLTGTTLGSLVDSYRYDANGLVASYSAAFGATTLYSEVVNTRDAVGRILKDTETVASVTHVWGYTYDATGRLTDVTEDGAAVSHYGYDSDDNRTTATTCRESALRERCFSSKREIPRETTCLALHTKFEGVGCLALVGREGERAVAQRRRDEPCALARASTHPWRRSDTTSKSWPHPTSRRERRFYSALFISTSMPAAFSSRASPVFQSVVLP